MEERPEQQENEIIKMVQSGDDKAFEELVKKYQKKVYSLAYRLLGNEEDAKDVTEDVFVDAWRAIKKWRGEASFFTWLYRVTVNEVYHKVTSAGYRHEHTDRHLEEALKTEEGEFTLEVPDIESYAPAEELQHEELQRLVREAIKRLDPPSYQVVVLHDILGWPYKEIASVLGCPRGTVMSRLSRARIKLKHHLDTVHREISGQ